MLALPAICGALVTANAQSSGGYDLSWHTVDGGGGTGSGGVFTVTGTIGQPAAGGPLVGGTFAVTGGFWALPLTVQTGETPTLSITPLAPGQTRISWEPDTAGFVLQETSSLLPANWVNSPTGATNPVSLPVTIHTQFYRLSKP